MNLLTAEQVTKSYTDKMLFDQITFGIDDADRIGLIGINGTGKSTLLRIVAGLEEPDEGSITKNAKCKIAYLSQNPEFDNTKSILENVCSGLQADEEYRNIEGEAVSMLARLGIPDASISPSTLSGGQKKRVSIVRTLLLDTNLLILDEPTNHLDSDMVEWLEEALQKYRGAILMVTHDRYFLDEVTTRIFELDKGNLYTYSANYSQFVALKAEREAMAVATERKNKSLYKMELAWMLRGARARSTKQKAHIQRFEALKNRAALEFDSSVELSSASTRLGKKTIELDHVSFAYEQEALIKDFSYIFLHGDRIGIIGPNGCGKSTLTKLLTRQLSPISGTIDMGSTVSIGYFSQENEALDESARIIDYIRDTADYIETKDGTITAAQMCERFLFDKTKQYSVISKLSGGEKRRLYLCKILMEAPNLLILDEPTNDLDIQTLTILEDYLLSFEGIVIAVSHDRYFLDKIATRLFIFLQNGSIRQFEGTYTDYKNSIPDELTNNSFAGALEKPEAESVKTWKNQPKKLKFTFAEQKEYDTIDDDIASLEEQIECNKEAQTAAATDYYKLEELIHKAKELEAALEKKMDRWVYLNDLAEQIAGQ